MRIVMHGHHAGSLFSLLDSLEDRIEFIKTEKPEKERALRLALIQDVTDLVPRNEARAAYEQAWAAYEQSFDTAAFHAAHCHPNCPWDGQTIFSKGTGIEVLQ